MAIWIWQLKGTEPQPYLNGTILSLPCPLCLYLRDVDPTYRKGKYGIPVRYIHDSRWVGFRDRCRDHALTLHGMTPEAPDATRCLLARVISSFTLGVCTLGSAGPPLRTRAAPKGRAALSRDVSERPQSMSRNLPGGARQPQEAVHAKQGRPAGATAALTEARSPRAPPRDS